MDKSVGPATGIVCWSDGKHRHCHENGCFKVVIAWHPHVLVLGIDANWIPAQMPRQSASALSARHGHIEQRVSYSLWVVRAGCHTFLNVFQCSNDKRKRAVRIWVVIAGNSTMLAMLASMYFMRVDCKDGRPKKDSMGSIAKGNLWPFEFVTAQEFLKSPSNNMLKLSCSLEAGRRCAPMWRRNHSWIVTWIKCRFFCLCPNAYNTQLQMRDRNLMKPTAYQYEHSKSKPKYQVDWQACQVQSDKPCLFARGTQIKLSKTIEDPLLPSNLSSIWLPSSSEKQCLKRTFISTTWSDLQQPWGWMLSWLEVEYWRCFHKATATNDNRRTNLYFNQKTFATLKSTENTGIFDATELCCYLTLWESSFPGSQTQSQRSANRLGISMQHWYLQNMPPLK